MKVGTDGILLGAWSTPNLPGARILDIGTGTGLIALMMAQRFPGAKIVGIELDSEAVRDARDNFSSSPWSERLTLFHGDVRQEAGAWDDGQKIDHIVSNPPFFRDGIKPASAGRARARHQESLGLADIVHVARERLHPEGRLDLILPLEALDELHELGTRRGYHINKRVNIRARPQKEVSRILVSLSGVPGLESEEELTIRQETGHAYSPEFKRLTTTFYLPGLPGDQV